MSKVKSQNYNLKLKSFILCAAILSFAFYALSLPRLVFAQTPANWQNNATGLRTTSNTDRKTAGLSTIIQVSGIPFMSLQGGTRSGGWDGIVGPTGIELGEIKIPGTTPALVSESADWAHNQMTFTNNLNLWVSRLSPAALIQSQNTNLRLFSGSLNGTNLVSGDQIGQPWNTIVVVNRPTPAPAYPKYVAYQSGGTVRVQQIPASGTIALSLPVLDNNWILVWFGNNSYFADTKKPLTYSGITGSYPQSKLPQQYAYQADSPILLKFENNPTSIIQTSEGGIDLNFGTNNSGYTSMMPLFGREHLLASDTEGWGTGGTLPANALTKINFWNTGNKLCSYPTNVSETYAYNAGSDTSTINENITYLNVCPGGSTTSGFAILPPMVAIARVTLGTNFSVSGAPIDAQYSTEFGPLVGIDNTNTYSYSISGLKKYTDYNRVTTNPSGAPAELVQELTSQVDKIIAAGHMAPWMLQDHTHGSTYGQIYFGNPADTIYYLSEIIPILPEPQKTNLINYIKSEKTNFPPETVYNLPLTQGTIRGDFALLPSRTYATDNLTYAQRWQASRPDLFLKRVPLYNFYALSRFYDVTGDTVPSTAITSAISALDNDMAEQDWATSYWFKGFEQKDVAAENVNRHFVGLVGLTRLAKQANNTALESLGRAVLAKAAVERIALLEYPTYLYAANLTDLNSLPANWQPLFGAYDWFGNLYNYNWTGVNDDARQVLTLNQFESYLYDHSGDSRIWWKPTDAGLIAFSGATPELLRLLTDYNKSKAEIYIKKVEAFIPSWYLALDMAQVGGEHGISSPTDSSQIFLAKEIIQNETPQNLEKYIDTSWLETGDLFYMQKLAETIKAYQGWAWEDVLATGPCTINSANWNTQAGAPLATAQVGTLVKLSVTATGNCTSNIRFEVRRYGSTPVDDIAAGTQPNPNTLAFINDQASTSWVTEFNPLIPFVTNPQYYFRISLDNGLTWNSVRSALLTVTQ